MAMNRQEIGHIVGRNAGIDEKEIERRFVESAAQGSDAILVVGVDLPMAMRADRP
jgi:hypothetical protein